jgi:hypothetical protein
MKKKYLLSTGLITDRVEIYVLDLFKLHLSVYPKDIPGINNIGFDFIITNTKKDELYSEVEKRLKGLVNKIQKSFSNLNIRIENSVLVDEKTLKITISVNELSDTISVEL